MGPSRRCLAETSVILFLSLFGHVTQAFILLAPPGTQVGNKNDFTLLDMDIDAIFNLSRDDDLYQIFVSNRNLAGLSSNENNETITLMHDTRRPKRRNSVEGWENKQRVGHLYRSSKRHSHRVNKDLGITNRMHSDAPEQETDKQATRKGFEYRDNIGQSPSHVMDEEMKMPEPLLPPGRASRSRKGQHSRVKRRARASVVVRVPPSRSFRNGIQTYIRSPRRSRVDAFVGVLVVADYSVYKQYMESNGNNHAMAVARIRRYYGMVFAMINERFQTIKDPYLSIKVTVSGILIAEKRTDSPWTEEIVNWSSKIYHGRASVDTGTSLRGFSKWLDGRGGLPDFDHAMVFTAYRLTDPQGVGLGGMAYLEAVCDTEAGNAVSIVGDKGDFQSVRVATHELAHSLGATHDGESGAESCPSRDAFIMSSMTTHNQHAPLRNAFYFSKCSIRDMSKHLSKSRSSCVRDRPPVYYHYDLESYPPGRIYSADLQCKMIFGTRSMFCGEGTLAGVMCGQLWCRDPNRNNGCRTNSYLTALPGTPCDRTGMCSLGGCVPDKTRQSKANQSRSSIITKGNTAKKDITIMKGSSDINKDTGKAYKDISNTDKDIKKQYKDISNIRGRTTINKDISNTYRDISNTNRDNSETYKDISNTTQDIRNVRGRMINRDAINNNRDRIVNSHTMNTNRDISNANKDIRNSFKDIRNVNKDIRNTYRDISNVHGDASRTHKDTSNIRSDDRQWNINKDSDIKNNAERSRGIIITRGGSTNRDPRLSRRINVRRKSNSDRDRGIRTRPDSVRQNTDSDLSIDIRANTDMDRSNSRGLNVRGRPDISAYSNTDRDSNKKRRPDISRDDAGRDRDIRRRLGIDKDIRDRDISNASRVDIDYANRDSSTRKPTSKRENDTERDRSMRRRTDVNGSIRDGIDISVRRRNRDPRIDSRTDVSKESKTNRDRSIGRRTHESGDSYTDRDGSTRRRTDVNRESNTNRDISIRRRTDISRNSNSTRDPSNTNKDRSIRRRTGISNDLSISRRTGINRNNTNTDRDFSRHTDRSRSSTRLRKTNRQRNDMERGRSLKEGSKNSIRNDLSRRRTNAIPKSHRVARPSSRIRKSRRNRRHRSRLRTRSGSRRLGRKQRRRGKRRHRCKGDKNVEYCTGLIALNPGGCRRRAIRQYCCATCKRKRRAKTKGSKTSTR